MSRLLRSIIVLLAVLSSVGCGAVQAQAPALVEKVWTVEPGTVINAVRAALTGCEDTLILNNGSQWMFVWKSQPGGLGFWVIDTAGVQPDIREILRGNLASTNSVRGLMTSLRASGWQDAAPGAVPAAVAQLVGTRIVNMPLALLAVGAFPGGFPAWMEDTFQPVEEQL